MISLKSSRFSSEKFSNKDLIELMDIENSKALKNRINTRLQEFATQQKTT